MPTYLSATEIAKKANTTPDTINALAARWHWTAHMFGDECCYQDTLAAKLCEYVVLDLVPPKDVMRRMCASLGITQTDASHLFFDTVENLSVRVYNRGLYNSGVTRADADRVFAVASQPPAPAPAPRSPAGERVQAANMTSKTRYSMRDLMHETGRTAGTLLDYARTLKIPAAVERRGYGNKRWFTEQEAQAVVDMAQQRRQAMTTSTPAMLVLLRSINTSASEISRYLARQDASWKQVSVKLDALLAVWAPPVMEKLEKTQDQALLEAAVEGNGEEHA